MHGGGLWGAVFLVPSCCVLIVCCIGGSDSDNDNNGGFKNGVISSDDHNNSSYFGVRDGHNNGLLPLQSLPTIVYPPPLVYPPPPHLAQAYYPGNVPFSYQNDSSSSPGPYAAGPGPYASYHPQTFENAIPWNGHSYSGSNNNDHSNNHNTITGPSPNPTALSALLVTQHHYPQSPASVSYAYGAINPTTTTAVTASPSSSALTSFTLPPSAPLLPPDMNY